MSHTILKQKPSIKDTFKNIASGITSFYIFIILTVFPLYTHDMYFDILGARYVFYKIWAISLCVLLAILGILYLIIDKPVISFKLSLKDITKHMIITDYFFIAMILVCTISFIGSEFHEEAFTGKAGRYQGLECWILYFLTYFAITRTYSFKKWHLDFAILAGAFSCIWGVLDFFMLDPFGFFRNVGGVQRTMFASSIGNLNTFTNYTIMVFGIAGTLFVLEKNIFKTIFYGLMSIIGIAGCVYGLADNALLGLFAFYLFIPFFGFKYNRNIVRYLYTISFLFIVLYLFWLSMKAPTWNMGQSSFFRDLVAKDIIKYLFVPFTLIVVLINLLLRKKLDLFVPNFIHKIYAIIVIIGFAFVIFVVLDCNVFHKFTDIWNQLPSSHQLYFNDYWGTHRGHNWRIAFTNFFDNFSLFKKLFGYGPDTYLIVSERTFYTEMVERFGEVYDSAHNEYINYLICEGLFGLISYLGIFVSGVVYAIKQAKKNPLILATAIAVLCYMVQAVVNIAIPITTPILFSLMYMGVADYLANRDLDVQQ